MTERHAFLSAIRESPDDDTPRLVYADWLEEHGEPERAELVRVGCERAAMGQIPKDTWNGEEAKRFNRHEELRCRERELLKHHVGGWTDFLPEALVTKECPSCRDATLDWETGAIECRRCDGTGLVPDYDRIEFSRGFFSEVICTWEEWQAHGDSILNDPWVPGLDKVVLTSLPVAESIDSDQILWAFFGLHSSHRLHRRFFDITMTPGNTSGMRIDERVLRQAWPAVRDWELPPEVDEVTARDVEAVIAQRTLTAGNWRDPNA